ncbi:MAG TPA: hypothetical protein VHX62_04785 [Solirubrobacteraceae bacterium]|nr:hypothetical protein [Solirubrobacteraceae bacterium]
MSPDPDLHQIGRAVVEAGDRAGVVVRVIGGVAVAMHAAGELEPGLCRSTADLDFIVAKSGRSKLDGVFAEVELEPDRRFNSLNGAERRIYHTPDGLKADVFLGQFRMCHIVPMDEDRLVLDAPTAPLAELVVTKAQVVQLTHKDAVDLVALLSDHELGGHDDGVINAGHVADLCSRDWGLWRTLHRTLSQVDTLLPEMDVADRTRAVTAERIAGLRTAIDDAPKSQKWRLRNRIGDRKIWYELPEDPNRADAALSGQLQAEG